MTIQQQPASLSLLGNMQQLVIGSIADVTMTLCLQGSEENLVEHTYSPDDGGTIRVDLKDIVEAYLSFGLRNQPSAYSQPHIIRDFTCVLVSGQQTETVDFKVIRAGVDVLSDTAENFLRQNFLTWQPTVKPVTYYTPEFLTYYAQESCTVKGRAYDSSGNGTAITVANLTAGTCYTIPTGYAVIAAIAGTLPSYYDIWVESQSGNRLTYIQRYYASDIKSEEEQWILFENSLGGIDTFRAYGDSENTAQHEHKIAEIEEENVEYRVDTERKHKKSTGLLDKYERRWLLDFFPSKAKYIYTESALRRIVVTESDVNYTAKELPSEYNFTYKFAEDKPYLNLPRTDASLAEMHIDVPDIGSFTIAPRLVEFPRQILSGGALIPTQDPYSENWGVTSLAAIAAYLLGDTSFTEGLPQNGLSENDVLNIVRTCCGSQFLSKVNADTAQEVITLAKGLISNAMSVFTQGLTAKEMSIFEKGLKSPDFVSGLFDGKGWGIKQNGTAQFANLLVQQMQVLDLVVNHLTAMDDSMVLAENDIIESVEVVEENGQPTGVFRLHLESKSEDYFTAQVEGNILMGVINTLPALAAGISQVTAAQSVESDGHNPYYTSWMRIIEVNAVPGNNWVDVVLFPDALCPAGVNFPPCRRMKVVRRGNVDATNHADRQNVIFLSSSEGRITMLTHVDKPIIEDYMYGYVMGNIPEFVQNDQSIRLQMQNGRSYLYIDGIICNQIIHASKPAAPNITYVQYEVWDNTGKTFYHCATANGQTDGFGNAVIETSDVWRNGVMWRCLTDHTLTEPKWNSPNWYAVTGNTKMSIEFHSPEGMPYRTLTAIPGQVDLTINPRLMYGDTDITDDVDNEIWSWARSTSLGDSLDNGWNANHIGVRVLHLQNEDLPATWSPGNPVVLVCSAHVRDGELPVQLGLRFT